MHSLSPHHLLDGKMYRYVVWNNDFNLIYNTWSGLTVLHPSRKNGEVTKSHNHTISILSWQGCAQFGFKSKRTTLKNLQKKSHVSLIKRTPHHVSWFVANFNCFCKLVLDFKTSSCRLALCFASKASDEVARGLPTWKKLKDLGKSNCVVEWWIVHGY